MLKLISFLLTSFLVFSDVVGYGFEMDLKNSSSFSYIVNSSKLRNIDVFYDGRKVTEVEVKPGEEKSLMFVFLTEGKNAEYGDVVLKKSGLLGCKMATLSFVVPMYSDHVVPALNRKCCLSRLVNRMKDFVVEKTFDHKNKKYVLGVRKIEEERVVVDSDM